jgi:hypothetical protein
MANAFDTIPTGETPPNAFDTLSPEAPRGVLGELATGVKRGALVDLPTMAGKALKYVGSPNTAVYRLGQSIDESAQARGQDSNLQLRPEQHGTVVNALAAGAETLPIIAGTVGAAAAGVAALPFELPTAAATGLTLAGAAIPSALEAGQSTLETAKENHIPEDKALTAARMNAGVAFAANTVLGGVARKTLGIGATIIGKQVSKEGATIASQTLAELSGAGASTIKPFVKQLGVSTAEATGVGAAQAGATVAINNEYGISDDNPLDAAAEAIPAMVGMTALLSPFGLASRALKVQSLKTRATSLANENTHPDIRHQLATQYFTELRKTDPEAAIAFVKNADTAIQHKLPLELDDGLFMRGAVQPPKPVEVPQITNKPIIAGAEVAKNPEQMAAQQTADQAAQERVTAVAREENRRALVDTHEQIKAELAARGVNPVQALTFAEFVKSMKKEAAKQKVDLTQADYEDMYQKHHGDVINANMRKAQEIQPKDVPVTSAGAEPRSALSVALQDAIKRKQADEAHSEYATALAAQKEKELNAIQNQTKGADQLAAAETDTLPVVDEKALPTEDIIKNLKGVAEDGQSIPPRLAKAVKSALSKAITKQDQLAEIRKLRENTDVKTASFELLDKLHSVLGGASEVGEALAAEKLTAEVKVETRGRKQGSTDDRHTLGDPASADELFPHSMTLEQARKDVGGIFTEKAWWQDLAWAVRNPKTKAGKELLENGKFTDEQMGQALKRDERYQTQDKLIAQMSAEREAALRQMAVEEAKPEGISRTDAQITRDLLGQNIHEINKEELSFVERISAQDIDGIKGDVKTSATVQELLPKLLKYTDRPELKQLIKDLERVGLRTNLHSSDKIIAKGEGASAGVVLGRYLPPELGLGDAIIIARGGNTPETILHEVVHAAVWTRLSNAAWQYQRLREGTLKWTDVKELDKGRIRAMREILEVFNDARDIADTLGEEHYGFTNLHEFISEISTDARLQDLLKAPEKNTLWNILMLAIKKLLGLQLPETMLDKAMTLSKAFYGSDTSGALPVNVGMPATIRLTQRPTLEHFMSAPAAAIGQTDGVLSKVAGVIKKISDEALPVRTKAVLSSTTLNHIRQTFSKSLPGLEQHVDAQDSVAARVKERNHAAQRITEDMAKLSDKDQRSLYNLMGESTRTNIFPNRPFEEQPWLKAEQKAEYNRLSQLYKSSTEIRRVYDSALAHNKTDYQNEYASILKNIGHLNEAPEKLWKAIDTAKGDSLEAKALEDWIYTKMDEGNDAAKDLRAAKAFHQERANSPYFHLGRNGDYFTRFTIANTEQARAAFKKAFALSDLNEKTIISPAESHVFARFENFSQQQAIVRTLEQLQSQGHLEALQNGKLQKNLDQLDSSAPAFIRSMMAKIDTDTRLSTEQKVESKDIMRRLYVEMLPETSYSKAFARRGGKEGVAGYDADMRRSFAKRAQASSYFVGHNSVRPELAEANRQMRESINGFNTAGSGTYDSRKAVIAQHVYDELRTRQANALVALETPILDSAGAFGYSWYLAANPAYIISNLFQPLQLTLPVLGGRHGYVNASKAMFRATGVAMDIVKRTIGEGYQDNKWRGVLDANVSIDSAKATVGEKSALRALVASGQAEWTQAHELGRVSEGGSERVNTAAKLGGIFSHYGEAINRIATGLAAYNLEFKRNGGDQGKAERFAIDTVKNTQFDYSGHNKARLLGKHGFLGPVTPIVSAFMQYNVQTLELLGRLAQQALDGDSPTAKAEARRALGGAMATTTLLAGTLGGPAMGLVAAAYNNLFSDEDKPVDMIADYRNFLADTFGKETGELIAHGPLRATGLDISSHLDLANIVPGTQFLNDRRQLKDKLDAGALALLGPSVGAIAGFAQGADKMAEGEYFKGLEMMLPTALKAPVKATDLYNNGATDSKGNPLPLNINGWDIAGQALNFTPSKLAEQREAQRGVNTKGQLLKHRAGVLQNKLIDALQTQDASEASRITELIKTFNTENPDYAIRNIRSIIRNRAVQHAVAVQSGVAVEGRGKNLPRIQGETGYAVTGGMV